MTISAKIILDSINVNGNRLTTMELKYPRFIHAEFMTHRVFSRNASSSRAIPVEKLIQSVIDDTAMPVHWGKNQPGMQAKEEHDELISSLQYNHNQKLLGTRQDAWILARDNAISVARGFSKAGYHKQIVNRLLEPFAHINVLVSSTDYENFFSLRDHPDAQPEIQILAREMKAALQKSTPCLRNEWQWHLPYTDDINLSTDLEVKKKISVARCASVSYKTVDGQKMSIDRAIEIFDKLYTAKPFHASPFEHVAYVCSVSDSMSSGNFKGWNQYRKILELCKKGDL